MEQKCCFRTKQRFLNQAVYLKDTLEFLQHQDWKKYTKGMRIVLVYSLGCERFGFTQNGIVGSQKAFLWKSPVFSWILAFSPCQMDANDPRGEGNSSAFFRKKLETPRNTKKPWNQRFHGFFWWWTWRDSNPWPLGYEPNALPGSSHFTKLFCKKRSKIY